MYKYCSKDLIKTEFSYGAWIPEDTFLQDHFKHHLYVPLYLQLNAGTYIQAIQ